MQKYFYDKPFTLAAGEPVLVAACVHAHRFVGTNGIHREFSLALSVDTCILPQHALHRRHGIRLTACFDVGYSAATAQVYDIIRKHNEACRDGNGKGRRRMPGRPVSVDPRQQNKVCLRP